MKRTSQLLFILCLIVISKIGYAQNAGLSGSIQDTLNYKPMAFTNISLIRYRDSLLVKHVWAREDGRFQFNNLKPDTYLVQITRPTFADYEELVRLQPGEDKQLGNISLISKTNLLREVIIKEKSNAIRIKGDTTEFLVDSFINNKNANVEDLLKRLPGIQVDKNGKITAQGKEVKKVLVDGEEFFGDDPTVATRNLRADNVEKVQVFDKKSDEANFTGIDDGQKDKTINLKLKEDAKKGYFGKASAAGGTNSRYEHDVMANSFKNKRKLSVYGAMSNTNKTRMSWEDANKYGTNDNNTNYDEASGMMYSFYNGDNMDYDGIGVPDTRYGGLHYSNKLGEDKHVYSFNGNRKELNTTGYSNNYSKYILPDTLYYVNQLMNVATKRWQNTGGAKYDWKVDSFSTLKFNVSGKQGQTFTESETVSENRNGNNNLVNENIRSNTNSSNTTTLTSSLTWTRKFRTVGRSLLMQFNQSYSNNNSDGIVKSRLNYYNPDGSVLKSDSFDQKKTTEALTNTYSGKIAYTEPLSKVWFILLDYDISNTLSKSNRISWSKPTGDPEYKNKIDTLSNDLRYDVLSNRGGLALRYVKKKLNISFGGKASYTEMHQEDVITGSVFNQPFFNLYPSASFNYKISTTSNFNIGYNGNTRQPSVQQIQPLQDNTNPLNVNKGNPGLKQSFNNRLNMFYNIYKPITGKSFYASMSYSFVNDDFTSFDEIDGFGRKVHTTINVNGNRNFWGYMNYYFSIKKYHLNIGTNLNPSINRNVNYINGQRNINNSQSISIGQDIYYEIEKKFEFGLDANWNFNHGTTSLRPDVVTQYWIQTYSVSGEVFLPKKFKVHADVDFNIRQKTADFTGNLNTAIFNGGISKKFLKSEALVIGIDGHDLFNQNLGFDRTANSNYVNEHVYAVLKRYVLFRVTWNFTKGPVENDDDE